MIADLDLWLEAYEARVVASGGVVHWAETAEEARAIVLDICRKAGARTVNKGKTMISEECGINDWLGENGITAVETDLGEYIIQLRGEVPSHIIAPAIHVTVPQVEAAFRAAHTHLAPDRRLGEYADLLSEARGVLRTKYFEAEVGITGANMLIAETGHSVIVTNEGNGDLSQSLPRVHIVMASLEKIVPTLEDASVILRLLGRSATGQEMSVYTTFSRGPRRAGDPDGPEEYHVVLLDNGRSNLVGTEMQEMLRCIRCGACMNHCPVYQAVGRPRLRLGLSGADRGGADAGADRGRGGGAAAERLDLLRALRGGLPGADPAAEADAALARARVGEAADAGGDALGARGVGVPGGAAVALPAGDAGRRRRAAGAGAGAGPARRGAACRRLDRDAGLSGAAGADVHGPVEGRAAVSARERILGRLERAAGRPAAERRAGVEARLAGHPAGPVPAQGRSHGRARVVQFMAKAEAAATTISRVSGIGELPRAVAHELRKRNLPAEVRFGSEPMFEGLDWGMLATSRGPGRIEEPATLSRAAFGLAETGTLVLASGAENPVTLTFLGETHFVVLREEDICGGFEDFWEAWRASGRDPRTINLVTGPSRSADIGQVLQLGAHGPVALHVFVVG